jgi:hypothetical protein
MADKFKNKYRIAPARMPSWDYGSHGLYLTICTKDRLHYLGDIISNTSQETQNIAYLQRTDIGEISEKKLVRHP